MKKFSSDARNNLADIVDTISRSYDKADEANFRRQTITSIFGMGTILFSGGEIILQTALAANYGIMLVSRAESYFDGWFYLQLVQNMNGKEKDGILWQEGKQLRLNLFCISVNFH